MERIYIRDLRHSMDNSEVELNGWIQEVRKLKKISFLILRDSTGTVQVTLKPENIPDIDIITGVNRESVISVRGTVTKEGVAKSGIEVVAKSVKILNQAGTPLPLGITDPVEADFDTRLNNRFLDLRKPDKHLIFRVESSLLWGIRKFLMSKDFIEVHTPKIVAAATEGGADLFRVQYFEKNAYLNQSPQLYKEILISGGIDRVFEVGPAFRAEEHNTVRHLNEFTSVDIEMAFSDHNDAMRMLENAVRSGIQEVVDKNIESLELHGIHLKVPDVPFPRITYRDCISILEKEGQSVTFGEDFTPEQLREIGKKFPDFYFITEWPSSVRPFYTMPKPGDDEVTNSYDLQFGEKEITSGAQRVHDPDLLEKRFRQKGLDPSAFEFYIKAFKYGMPPHAGWGLGLERLSMIILNLPNIREVTLFPRDRTRIVP
ncbi:MAG: hypothetical protein AMDU1_APLC00031G0012 [Thermoplasmatales archaeon A-plasma]|jgi:aspartyl-tRNA synthetase|nr:MAG: hypothetical protein AMDU1_APLC00031G0012 [Thermoplasmatales archaeon A-plasma]WMT44065.1 MAG: aspartate--tRNA(Asn) ligase [Cuniculiplasma divulgatum]